MRVIQKPQHCPIKMWTSGVSVEEESLKQLNNISKMPFIFSHIAVMPDVHWGMGATVGSVIPTMGAIIPAAVGVDIGCGMMAVRTSLKASDLPDNLHEIRCAIEQAVPHGRPDNGGANDRGAWHDLPLPVQLYHLIDKDWLGLKNILEKHPKLGKKWTIERAIRHVGTLGTGNHFIELCLDQEQSVWIMLHSGSRGIGNAIGNYFIELAKEDMRKWFINVPDKDLAYFPEETEHFDEYCMAIDWAQCFARSNRCLMLDNIVNTLKEFFPSFGLTMTVINCHHNYVEREHHFGKNVWVTRKGAVRARTEDLGVIPGSMGAKSFIVMGKGNPDSFHSCSHGAGRVMSRTEARKTISLEQHIADTQGVECRKDAEVVDESPRAYKDIDAVMAAQSDLVEILYTLKQVLCVKG